MTTREKIEKHIICLEEKLKRVKMEAVEAYMQGSDLLWENLKKKKLKIKDEIEQCKRKIGKL